jgi:hypothetical protein
MTARTTVSRRLPRRSEAAVFAVEGLEGGSAD